MVESPVIIYVIGAIIAAVIIVMSLVFLFTGSFVPGLTPLSPPATERWKMNSIALRYATARFMFWIKETKKVTPASTYCVLHSMREIRTITHLR